jgi:hypothetical protein
MLHILCCVTREQALLHRNLPDLVRRLAPGEADATLLALPDVPRGPFFYRLSAHRVPSDVHPVRAALLREALAPVRARHVLLLDGSILPGRAALESLVAAVATLAPECGLALPVRYNLCPLGPMRTFFCDGSLRFEYGVLPRETLAAVLETAEAVVTGDPLLAELAVRGGTALSPWEGVLHRHPERLVLTRGRYGREPGLPCPDDVSAFGDFHRCFVARPHAPDAMRAWRDALREAGLAVMADAPDAPGPALRKALRDGLDALRPDLAQALREHGPQATILRLMAAIEPYLDVFESRVEALSCLVLLYRQELASGLRLGDREFWAAFSRYTTYDEMALSKLLYLKA